MKGKPWRSQAAFGTLCDIVASDKLICMTGAGISQGLSSSSGAPLPNWPDLLKSLRALFDSFLSEQDKRDVDFLLKQKWPAGDDLIEAATILRTGLLWTGREGDFDAECRTRITEVSGATSETHRALLRLQPRGIWTFNYDMAHENAAAEVSFTLARLKPDDESAIGDVLRSRMAQPFLLKAHGSVHDGLPLVLTYETYRHLFAKCPAYRAFVQDMLTNYNLVFVGFRMSDPDFAIFVHTISAQYGSPLQNHVVIKNFNERSGQDVTLRRRYGIHALYVSSFANIPVIIDDARAQPGPLLNATITRCLVSSRSERQQAHKELRKLGPAGKVCAATVLRNMMLKPSIIADPTRLSELVYSLGYLDMLDPANKAAVWQVLQNQTHGEPIAHGLAALLGGVSMDDVRGLRALQLKLAASPPRFDKKHRDPSNRIPKYIDYLILVAEAKDISPN